MSSRLIRDIENSSGDLIEWRQSFCSRYGEVVLGYFNGKNCLINYLVSSSSKIPWESIKRKISSYKSSNLKIKVEGGKIVNQISYRYYMLIEIEIKKYKGLKGGLLELLEKIDKILEIDHNSSL
ncbi:MAG: hypothetical protein J7L39_01625 [Candidatus Aenigmarchaeota archaeon]|nr:hypothetical protein [Candidatus Aenigmarchaeota archaeon]